MEQDNAAVRRNPGENRYELDVGGTLALAEYVLKDGTITFTHTETPPALQGQGVASRLIRGALTDARKRGLTIRATCSFVADYLKRHPEFST